MFIEFTFLVFLFTFSKLDVNQIENFTYWIQVILLSIRQIEIKLSIKKALCISIFSSNIEL